MYTRRSLLAAGWTAAGYGAAAWQAGSWALMGACRPLQRPPAAGHVERTARHVERTATRAKDLYRRAIVINGNLVPGFDDAPPLDRDFKALIQGSGITAIKASLGGSGRSFDETMAELAAYDRGIDIAAEIYTQIRSVDEIRAAKASGKMGIIYSFESVEMLEGNVERIAFFAHLGVKIMQLAYNHASAFSAGALSDAQEGITALGHQAITVMNQLGVALDLSHANETSALQAAQAATRPVLMTHTGCRAVHDNPRNKSDRALRAVAETGGVVGIYELSFLTPTSKQQTLDDYLRHLEHALNVCGEDHVGIGSDALVMPFDTSPKSMAAWDALNAARKAKGIAAPGEGPPPFVVEMNRPDRSLIVAEALLEKGHAPRVVEKVLGANFMRAFDDAWNGTA